MKFTRKEKRIYVLLFSMTCFLIIFALYKNLGSSPSNGLRNLIEYSDFEDRCKDLKNKLEKDYSEKEGEFEWNKETLEGYQNTLIEIIKEKEYGKISKYLPRVLTYLIVAIVGIIFIIFWIVFCCFACKTVGRQDSVGCGAKCCFIIYLILCLAVIFFCVMGIIYTSPLKQTLNSLACSTYKLVFETLPDKDDDEPKVDSWIGLYNISENLNTLYPDSYEEQKSIVQNMISIFEDIKSETLNDTEKIMKHVDHLDIYNSLIGFGGIALFNFFGLLSMFLIFVCQCKCMSCLYHIFWNIEIIFIICTFFISAIIGSLSNVSKDISEILSSQIYSLNQSNANKMDFIFNFSEIGGPVNACIFGEQNLYSYIFKDNANDNDLKNKSNCTFFEEDFKIIVYGLKETVSKKLFYVSLLYIIADVVGIVSIFLGITIYNSQKGYNPPNDINVNINNRMPINNRIDLSTENLKRQNNEIIFSKK